MGDYIKIDAEIDAFIDSLKKWEPDEQLKALMKFKDLKISNIYSDADVDNAKIRRDNLFFYLKKMKDLNPSRLFVGEAPGRWGCSLTGIPFTSEAIISKDQKSEDKDAFFNDSNFQILSKKNHEFQTEETSKFVWGCLNQLCMKGLKLPLLWNIYPFQLWKDGKKCKDNNVSQINGKPEDIECKVGIKFLFKLLECFSIKEIYLIGEVAEKTLKVGFPVVRMPYIRHPSRKSPIAPKKFIEGFDAVYQIFPKSSGELEEFIKRINEIYGLKSEDEKNLDESDKSKESEE
jgi:hypothetical protein